MSFDFLVRSLRATAIVTAALSLALAAFVDGRLALAVAAGSTWSLLNFIALGELVRAMGYRGRPNAPLRAVLLLGLKGPLLYLAGYALLRTGLSTIGLVGGFSLVFLVVTLRALGLWIAHPEWRQGARGTAVVALAVTIALGAGARGARASAHAEHAAEAHSEEAHGEGAPELPNVVTYLRAMYQGKPLPPWLQWVHHWENILFSFLAALILIAVFGTAARAKRLVPGPAQNAAEALFGGLHDFFLGILGPSGKPYIPFIGSLMLYIVTMNWMGMIPFLKSPNTSLNTTFALAICVFFYVQWIGISRNGLLGYLYHFAGQPKDAIGWGSAVLLFPLEVMGEFIKPISLSCRLFGNILGEDILLAVFVGLGVTALSFVHSPIGLPLQLPFLVLSTLFGLVQGLVFALLTTVYIVMMLPHDDHHEAHAGDAQAVAHP
jgi:F-type H+-transporting ATPase subunit a